MTLNEYLSQNRIPLAVFAKSIGCTTEAVRLWSRGQRMPRPAMVEKIEAATHRAVRPADWYGQEAA